MAIIKSYILSVGLAIGGWRGAVLILRINKSILKSAVTQHWIFCKRLYFLYQDVERAALPYSMRLIINAGVQGSIYYSQQTNLN